jgi:hypothetical protein
MGSGPLRLLAAWYRPLVPRYDRLGVDSDIAERSRVTQPPHRPSGRIRWIAGVWRERFWLVAFAALLTLCRLPTIDGWDDAFYVGQLTSVLGDRDLRLQDDVALVPKPFTEKCRILTTVLPSGALANTFSIGPALLLSPFVLPAVSSTTPPPWLPFRAASALAAMSMLLLTAFVCPRRTCRFPPTPPPRRWRRGSNSSASTAPRSDSRCGCRASCSY